VRRLVFALAAALLCACASATRYDAAGDIRSFLIAVRDGDKAAFDAHVDRPALKANLKARLIAAAAGSYGVRSKEAGAAVLAGPLVDVAVEALTRPQVFRAAASLAGYGPETKVPGPLVLGQGLKALDSERVCAVIKGRCAFIFKEQQGTWRLIDFDGDLSLLDRAVQR
jgi:hypothetical protein